MMQKVNAAYEVIKKGTTSTKGSTTKQDDEEYNKKKKEWQERERKAKERKEKVMQILQQTFQPLAFVSYFQMLTGKDFDYDIRWLGLNARSNYIGAKVTFESSDLEYSIPFNFTVNTILSDEDLENKNFTFMIENYVFYKNSKYKMFKETHKKFTDLNVLTNPKKAFPEKKMKDIIQGKKKAPTFKKKDMLAFLKDKLNADIQQSGGDLNVRMPIGDNHYLMLYRVTMMRQATWGINGLYSLKPRKRVSQPPTAFFMENEETANLFKEIQEKGKKAKSEDRIISIIDKIVKQYKKDKGM